MIAESVRTSTVAQRPSPASVSTRLLQRKCACGGAAANGECENCGQEGVLQRRANGPNGHDGASPSVHDVLRSPGYPLDSATGASFGHDFSRIPVNAKAPVKIQTTLTVNTPGDVYEQEADRISGQVLAAPSHLAVGGAPQRIRRYSVQSNRQIDAASESVDHALTSPGSSLEPDLRRDMENRFGYDFSRVRVHSGSIAGESARSLNAKAYTVGNDIVFGRSQFTPQTLEGRRLLAHELTHVVEQSVSRKQSLPRDMGGTRPSDLRSAQPLATCRSVQRDSLGNQPKLDPQVAALVQMAVDELDRKSPSEKVLLSNFINADKLDLKHWAVGLQAQGHRESGNYLLLFYEDLSSDLPDAGVFMRKELAKVGVDLEVMATEVELHKLLIEEQSRPLKVDLREYPIYDWKVAVGGVLKPFVEVFNVVIHLVPVVGEALSAFEALVGEEILTGRRLEGWERLLSLAPYAGPILRSGKKGAQAILAIAREGRLSTEAVLSLLKRTSAISKDVDQLREIKALIDNGGQLAAEQRIALRKAYSDLKPLETEMGAASKAVPHTEPHPPTGEQVRTGGEPAPHAPPHEPKPPAGKASAGAEHAATKTVQELEHDGVAARITTSDGHDITITNDGTAWICTDPCDQFAERYRSVFDKNTDLSNQLREIRELKDPTTKANALGQLKTKIEKAPITERQYLAMESPYRYGTRRGSVLRLDPEDWTHILKRHVKSTFDAAERPGAKVTTLFKGTPAAYLEILDEAVRNKAVVSALSKGNGEIRLTLRGQEWLLNVDVTEAAIKTFRATGLINKKLFEVI